MVEFEDTVVAIVSTYDAMQKPERNSLYKLNCSSDVTCKWQEMSQKLAIPRNGFVAIMVPDEMTNCQ